MIVLDTHVWVNWLLLGESSLTPSIISAMANERDVAVSAVSCFEVSLLVKRGKLELPLSIDEWLPEALGNSGIDCVPVSCEIARLSVSLQDVHKDPADRIIIATVLAHDALLASLDATFAAYTELAGRLVSR